MARRMEVTCAEMLRPSRYENARCLMAQVNAVSPCERLRPTNHALSVSNDARPRSRLGYYIGVDHQYRGSSEARVRTDDLCRVF